MTRFSVASTEPAELLMALNQAFGGSSMDGRGIVSYPQDGTQLRVEIRRGRVQDVRRGRSSSTAEIDRAAGVVRELLIEDQTQVITTSVCFTDVPVTGFYRAPTDEFQILPAPPQAPRPPWALGAHPFLLQHATLRSSSSMVTGHRISASVRRWTDFLTAALGHPILPPSAKAYQTWGIVLNATDVTAATPIPLWMQESYWIPGWEGLPSDRLAEPTGDPIELVDNRAYYPRAGIALGESFKLPLAMDSLVVSRQLLDGEAADRFQRSCHWLATSHDVWRSHVGSWVIALVAAIETLASIGGTSEICENCGTDVGHRPTARFREFLTGYAPGITPKEIADLYDMRSDLVHGTTLLHMDGPFGQGALAYVSSEHDQLQRLRAVVSVAIVRWLLTEAQASAGRSMATTGSITARSPSISQP